MKNLFWSCCIILTGTLLAPCSSFALMHISNSNLAWECAACHPNGGPSGGYLPCLDCHKNSSGGGYSDLNTIEVATHSSAVIGSDNYGQWEKECLDCHQNHNNNGLTDTDGILDDSYILVDLIANNAITDDPRTQTTFTFESVNIHDQAWADPATWAKKTGAERGLIFVMKNDTKFFWYEVIGTTDTTITIANVRTFFPTSDNPISAQLMYGMLIRDEVNGTPVKAGGSSTMAYDESGDGSDETPDGICQVCHTQTTHWRSDGSGANHFSGWNCIVCHPHEQGFKPAPPPLCPCDECETSPPKVWDCTGTWGGDAVVDNCGTCDNDPGNDCTIDCEGTWGGDAIRDACHVCEGDSTTCEDDENSEYYPVDRSGTVTVSETGLMWQQAPADVNSNGTVDAGDRLIFSDAMNYCDDILFAGYTDWRLATKDEMKELVVCVDSNGTTLKETPLADNENCGTGYVKPTIDTSLFDSGNFAYWSNGPDAHYWYVSFNAGRAWFGNPNTLMYVRCVR